MNRESFPRDAPRIPYRKLTKEERDKFWDYARELKDTDRFWQQTIPEARRILREIQKGGFVIGGELAWGYPTDSYGSHNHIYQKDYVGRRIKEDCDYKNVIGSVDLWESGGFVSNPVCLWYENLEVIESVLELRDYLIKNNISFCDSVSIPDLKKEVSDLDKKRRGKLEILSRLEHVQLREN
jgi:hypothetical protein